MKKYYLMLFLCIPLLFFSQNQDKIDSLETQLSIEKNDSIKVELLTQLFHQHIHYDVEKARSYNNLQFKLARENGDNFTYSRAYFLKAYYYFSNSDFDNAIKNLKKSLVYVKRANDSKMEISINGRLGHIYNKIGKKDSAIFHINKAIDLSLETGDTIRYAVEHLERGNYYVIERKLDEALKSFRITDSVLNTIDKKHKTIPAALNNISLVYITLKDYDKAKEYSLKSKKLAEELNLKLRIIEAEKNLGFIEYYKGNYTEAEKILLEVLEYFESVNNRYEQALIIGILGEAYFDQDKNEKAKKYLLKSIEIRREILDSLGLIHPLQNMGRLYLKEKNYDESLKFFNESMDILYKIPDLKNEVFSLQKLAEINYSTENYKASAEFYKKYISLKDSLTNTINYEKVAELETRYQTAQKEQQIELLSTENELAEQKRKNQLMFFTVLAALMLIVGFSLLFAYRNKIKTAQKIKELNEMKSRFFANISHEFRTPLTLIKSPLQSLQSSLSDEKQQKQLSLIDKNSDRMLELVNQLLELSKIDSGNLKLILKEGNIGSFLNSIAEPFAYQAKENGLKFSSNIAKPDENHSFDKDVIEKIVTNLLSNALKYTPEGQKISFVSHIENASPASGQENLKIKVSNSGSGLKKSDLPKLFERFYQKKEEYQGFGIGLALVKELVELYNGNVETSLDNDILNFEISLPLTQNETENIVIQSSKSSIPSEIQHTETDDELPVLLVVDDNPEIRNVLKDIFSDNYTVLEAENGKIALKLAQKEIPDCIISDVMMPGMDGFEFTQKIKNNELTSFIPVVLLTAKTSEEAHLESLKSTADAYLTKPFNNEILKETVLRQIAERKKLQERYSRELILKPVDIAINTFDEKFLEKLGTVMKKHLSDTGFSTDAFASEMGMSRMQLHRKLKTLLGVSTTEFIRNERLKAAVELMKKGHNNVSEIAYTVGFSDVSYFSKCFKELYDVTPTEYIHNM